MIVLRWFVAVLLACPFCGYAQSAAGPQTVVHILDYIGVDYSGAVEAGRVKDAGEYKEMVEFATQVQEQLKALPANSRQAQLLAQARELSSMVARKADPSAVAELSRKLRWDVIGAYDVTVVPRRTPDVSRGAALYTQICATCHGVEGRGDGVAARGLDPQPADFHDASRMANRSVYSLYNAITLGVSGTAMTAFKDLSDDDRWALAFFVSTMGVPAAEREQGKALWAAGEARNLFADLTNVATLSKNEITTRGGARAAVVYQYLRANPGVIASGVKRAPLDFARDTLKAALDAYARGERPRAQQLAVSAYLEGFELVEPGLDAVDHPLRVAIETDMLSLRNLMRDGAPLREVEIQVDKVNSELTRAREQLSGSALSPSGAAASAFIILVREGLEAILVLAAIIAFLVKANRRDALRYIHAGWIAALVLGIVTWVVASYAVAVSGAGREMTEGITALVSTLILLYVGWWLHDKSHARAWKQFIEDRLAGALSRGTIWALASLSFLAVYREVFEMVLFYEALWVQAGEPARHAVIGGFVLAAIALAVVAWLIFRYGVRLPIGLFFGVSSAFLAALAVVFAGQGVGALQEAGAVDATVINFPRIPSLGVFPTVQSLSAQLFVCAAVLAVIAWSRYAGRGSRSDAQ